MRGPNKANPTLVVMLALAITVAATATLGIAQSQGVPIWLKSDRFMPGTDQVASIPPGLFISQYAQNQRGYYIVQFSEPVEQSWKDALSATGAEILSYIPDFAFKVRMNPAQARRAENLGGVNWVGIFQPAYKLSPDLIRNGTHMYAVRLEKGSNLGLANAAVAATGAQILSRDKNLFVISADSDQINAVARILDVAWIDNYTMFEKHNDFAGGVILGSNTANINYDGSSQTLAVADTGLGGGTDTTAHLDIDPARIVGIFNRPGTPNVCYETIFDDGAMDVDSGHGTHTTLSAVGAGALGRGTAPGANLIFQAVENRVDISWACEIVYGYKDGYYLTGIPGDLNDLFQQAYDGGARIHSNSWGARVAGQYDANSANTDEFIWNNPDMVISFSAGNEGADDNADGIIDDDSMASPGTAKNVITVGASENERQDGYPCDAGLEHGNCSGFNEDIIATYGTGMGYPAEPIYSDLIAGNKEQMAAFSSRGPTDDGRIKPDVVAPGTYVLSGYSDMYQQYYDPSPHPDTGKYQFGGWAYPESDKLKYWGGTSMSNPLVAGGAAVVRDYYQIAHNVSASAALVKATIINSAVDMLDENNDGYDDNDYPIPNSHEGWGRVDLAAATSGSIQYKDNTGGLITGASAGYEITTNGNPLKITLVWSDYPSSADVSVNLVNDLDLIVTGGDTYYGNVFSAGWSISGGSEDRINNVENVYIANPGSGAVYTIEVKGYNIPYGPQPYALVVDGASFTGSGSNLPPIAVAFATNPASGPAPHTVSFSSAGSNDPDGSIVEYSWDFGDSSVLAGDHPTADHTYSDPGTYTVTLTVEDNDGATGQADPITVTVTENNETIIHVKSISIEVVPAKKEYALASVLIQKYQGGDPINGAVVTGTWSGIVSGTSTATTGANGIAILKSPNTKKSGTYTFTVTNVTAVGWDYDASKNEVSSASSGDDPPPPPPPNPGDPEMHVGNLMSYTFSPGLDIWGAGVSVRIHDENHGPVLGRAIVHATWGGGYKGKATCETMVVGNLSYCAIVVGTIPIKKNSVTFTVTDVTHEDYVYQPSANHSDDDGDGTRVVIKRPQ